MRLQFPTAIAWLAIVTVCSAQVAPVDPKSPAAVQFQRAYHALLKADAARSGADPTEPVRLYMDALDAYMKLAARYPDWQPGVVQFRISYCDNQLEALLHKRETGLPDLPPGPDHGPVVRTPVPATPAVGPPRQAPTLERATSLLVNGDAEQARQVLIELLNTDPDHDTARLLIGVAQCQLGNYRDAVHVLEPLTEERPEDAEARVALAAAYFGTGRHADCLVALKAAVKLKPTLHPGHYNLAQVMLAAQPPDVEGARQHYRRAVELGAPRDPGLDFLLGDAEPTP